MCPIKGLSETRRLPRLGKIHLGVKVEKPGKAPYPRATDYFVCPPEVTAVYGKEPKRLDVIIPVEDEEIWANQYYRQYSRSRGLVCKGDGEFCRRMIDTKTGDIAGRETLAVDWREGLSCPGRNCPDYKSNACQEVMNLQFLLPKVAGLGVWQIDTGSINSILNINSDAEMIRAMCGHVAWIPLTLSLEPTEVINPDDGKKKTVHCLRLRYNGTAEDLLKASEQPRLQVLLGKPVDDEPPDDRLLSMGTPEKKEEFHAKVQDDVDVLWPQDDSVNSSTTVTISVGTPEKTEPKEVKLKKEKPSKPEEVTATESKIDLQWLKEALEQLQWTDCGQYLISKYKVKGSRISEMVGKLTPEQQAEFVSEVQRRLDADR